MSVMNFIKNNLSKILFISFSMFFMINANAASKFDAIFDQNYGYGLECDNGTSYFKFNMDDASEQSKCKGSFSEVTFPKSSAKMYRDANYLLGWTKIVLDGKPACIVASDGTNTIIPYTEKDEINGDTTYYACYEQTVNAIRYAGEYASADGKTVECGSALEISYCYKDKADGKELCKYTKNGNVQVNGIVYRDSLKTGTMNKEACEKSRYDEINGDRYTLANANADEKELNCGNVIYVTKCYKDAAGKEYCKYTKVNGEKQSGTVYRDLITDDKPVCEIKNGDRYVVSDASADGQNIDCGSILFITECYTNSAGTEFCKYSKVNGKEQSGTVYRDKIRDGKPSCAADTDEVEDEVKCTTDKQRNIDGKTSINMCVSKGEKNLEKKANNLVSCANNYELDEDYTSINGNTDKGYVIAYVRCVLKDEKNDKDNENSNKYDTTGSYNISLSVSSGIVQGTTGTIKVNATSKVGKIEKYYYSESYKAPTTTSSWKNTDSESFTIENTPGIIYIWVMDSEGNISNGVGGAVFDTVNTDTTINKLELYDANGNIKSPTSSTAYKVDGITSSNYVRLSNNLSKDSIIADNGFNPYDMEYKLEVSSPTISVYATLTSTDASYVSGYEPRTVNLEYGINTILIKIQNNEGKIRTYTILVTRKDDRTADNTLSDISIDTGSIEFNSNKAEYKIEISKSIQSVNVNATIGSNKASFVEGYEPGNVKITGDATVKLLKVKSETGTTRTYVLTFVKEGTDIISDESLQLSGLSIPGVRIAFEPEISNYSLSVGYSTDVIDLNTVLNEEGNKVLIKQKRQSDTEYKFVSNTGINLDVGENFLEILVMKEDGSHAVYRLTIIRKEFGLELENDTTLNELKVLGHDIEFNPNVKDYTVRIKKEKTLVITAIPNSTRSEVFIRGNDELTGFSTVRVKVVAENGDYETYSIDIKKDAFNKTIEILAIVAGVVIIIGSSCIIVIKNKKKRQREYIEE